MAKHKPTANLNSNLQDRPGSDMRASDMRAGDMRASGLTSNLTANPTMDDVLVIRRDKKSRKLSGSAKGPNNPQDGSQLPKNEQGQQKERHESLWKDVWEGIRSNKAALISMCFIILLALIAIITKLFPQVLPYDPYLQNLSQAFLPPSPEHWCGTDQQGRDIFTRILTGAQISLTVGLAAVAISLSIGVILGAIAGYRGGATDTVIMRFMDMMLAIPSILLAIAIMAALGKGVEKAVIAIGLVAIPEYARIVRSEILSIKESDYVAAARIVGDSSFQIIFRHILPNVMPSIIVRATLGISTAVLDTAALGFLGLGVQPPLAEWGDMLGSGRNDIFRAPWLMTFPGVAIMLTVLAFNLLGNGIRDGLDPKARKR